MGGKRIKRTPEEIELRDLDKEITEQLESMLPAVLKRTESILDYPIDSVQSLHGKIGGKNDKFANVAEEKFQDYRAFQRKWADGLLKSFEMFGSGSSETIVELFKDDLCREYILLFLERNFYRHYNERIRVKPESELWKVWFGNQLCFGLWIAPQQLPNGVWRIDHSEIRRAKYNYWTVGHILSVGGFINPDRNDMYPIRSVDDLSVFYEHIICGLSNSEYEKAICDRYIDYLRNSSNVNEEPFLIPEFHYEGFRNKCKYRLDFTILNPHTFEFTGFELSPSSTHMHLEKTKEKTQKALNDELSDLWAKECKKRNEYYEKFNISCITFTDDDLKNIDNCFRVVADYLQKRNTTLPTIGEVLNRINKK